MDMNNKGQISFVLGAMFFVIAISFAVIVMPALKDLIDESRSADSMNCDNTSISSSQYMTCLEMDLVIPMFIGALIFAGLSAIFFKLAG